MRFATPSLSRPSVLLQGLLLATLLFSVPPAAANEDAIGTARLQIAGTQLTASPAQQTVPFDTATIVETALEGFDPSFGVLPETMVVEGELVGPEIDGFLTLRTVPGEPFRIPRLRVEGDYRLENIRLVMDGAPDGALDGALDGHVMAYAEPRDVGILVTQILITRVSSRVLTLDEIRSHGLVIDEDNYSAINLTFAFGVAGNVRDYNMPLVFDNFGPEVESVGNLDGAKLPRYAESTSTVKARFRAPKVVPFMIEMEQPPRVEVKADGCDPRAT